MSAPTPFRTSLVTAPAQAQVAAAAQATAVKAAAPLAAQATAHAASQSTPAGCIDRAAEKLHRVACSFSRAEGDLSQLSLLIGDLVRVQCRDPSGWTYGRLEVPGATGLQGPEPRAERAGDAGWFPEGVLAEEVLEDHATSSQQVPGDTDMSLPLDSPATGASASLVEGGRSPRSTGRVSPRRTWTGVEEARLQEYEQKLYSSASQRRRVLTAQMAAQSGVLEEEEAVEAAQRVVSALEVQERRLRAEAAGMAGSSSQRLKDSWEAKLRAIEDKKEAAIGVAREARERLESERQAVDIARQQLRTEKHVASIAVEAVTRQRGRAKAAAERAAEILPLSMPPRGAGAPPPKSTASGIAFGGRARSHSSTRAGGGGVGARASPDTSAASRSESRRRCRPAPARRRPGDGRSASPLGRAKDSSADAQDALDAAEILQAKLAQIKNPALQRRCEALAADLVAAAKGNVELPVPN